MQPGGQLRVAWQLAAHQPGGLQSDSKFVILGDYNADPLDGDSTGGAILQLLESPWVNTSIAPPRSSSFSAEMGAPSGHRPNPLHITTLNAG